MLPDTGPCANDCWREVAGCSHPYCAECYAVERGTRAKERREKLQKTGDQEQILLALSGRYDLRRRADRKAGYRA